MFPLYAWGEYLDEHGVTVSLPRKDEVKATGEVTFTAVAGGNVLVATGTQVATVQTDPDADPIVFATTVSGTVPGGGSLVLAVEAVEAGATGNAGAGTVTTLASPVAGIASVTNVNAMSGGADVESDDLYRERLLLEWTAPRGAGTQADYERWALSFPPVGRAVVEPLWEGPGSVRVIVTDQAGNPVSGSVLTGLKNVLDPEVSTTAGANATNSATLNVASTQGFPPTGRFRLGGVLTAYTGITATTLTGCGNHAATTGGEVVTSAGLGAGLAPIGATVTVATVTTVNVAVAADVTYAAGYSKDGAAGTIGIEAAIIEALKEYIDHLNPGDDVILEHVSAQFFTVVGVYDVTAVTLNGSAANVAISALQVAHTSTVTLT